MAGPLTRVVDPQLPPHSPLQRGEPFIRSVILWVIDAFFSMGRAVLRRLEERRNAKSAASESVAVESQKPERWTDPDEPHELEKELCLVMGPKVYEVIGLVNPVGKADTRSPCAGNAS